MYKILITFLFAILFSCHFAHAKPQYKRFSESCIEPWGVDASLTYKPTKPITASDFSLSSKACQSMIRFFQVYISPIDGPRSSFIPSSSQYAMLAIQKHGVFMGIALGCDRLMRENKDPWVYRTIPFNDTERKYDVPR